MLECDWTKLLSYFFATRFVTREDRGINRNGGGVAIFCRNDIPYRFLDNLQDLDHESLWIYAEPKSLPRHFSCIILVAVYYPESARNRKELILHLQKGVDYCRTKFSCPAIVVCGDFNQTNKQYLAHSLGLKQVVKSPTHIAGGTLDLILTNSDEFYMVGVYPVCLSALGKSDHFTVLWKAKAPTKRPKRTQFVVRPTTESNICSFGRWIGQHDFSEIINEQNLDKKTQLFNSVLYEKYKEHFPTKTVYRSYTDRPWITPEIKALIKQRGQSHDARLRNKVVALCRTARRTYASNHVDPTLFSNSKKWHDSVKR